MAYLASYVLTRPNGQRDTGEIRYEDPAEWPKLIERLNWLARQLNATYQMTTAEVAGYD